MIPIVMGVVMLNFILFNVAGGSAATMAMGEAKNASPLDLEQYDEVRGYNKPLFFGNWTTTRAHDDTRFDINAGAWSSVDGVDYAADQHTVEILSDKVVFPLAFDLRPSTQYRFEFQYALSAQDAGNTRGASFVIEQSGEVLAKKELKPGQSTFDLELTIPEDNRDIACLFKNAAGIKLYSVTLRRGTRHPLDSQFLFYLGQIARLDFGRSEFAKQDVIDMLASRIGPTLCLTIPILTCGLLMAISLSLLCAFFHNTFIDRFFVFISVALMSVNYLVWIIAGQFFLGFRMGLFPVWGFESWKFLLLPVLVGVFHGLGADLRFYRTVMLDEMYRDYVRTAFAKGAGKMRVLFRHVLPNALIPVITRVIIAIPFLYTGSLLLERYFGIPGVGDVSLNAILYKDMDVIRTVVLLGSVLFVLLNLLMDILYTAVDPRMRLK
jgi:peptide/nickel transport system permease protein